MRRFVRSTSFVAVIFLASACTLEVQHDLTEEDANDIYVLLQGHNIDATKHKEGEGKEARYNISVPKAHVASAAQLLREFSLPRPRSDGLSIFKMTKGMIPTQTEERAMFIEALGGEVSNALNRIPGVLEARTIVMLPEVNDLTQPEKKPLPSASVLIKYMLNKDGKIPVAIDDVQGFVANAVPELKKENVKVLMTEAKFEATADNTEATQVVLGVKVVSTSAGTFKAIIGVFALLFIAMAGLTGFMVIRKPAARPAPRPKTQEG
jgi:type III secretion protein J